MERTQGCASGDGLLRTSVDVNRAARHTKCVCMIDNDAGVHTTCCGSLVYSAGLRSGRQAILCVLQRQVLRKVTIAGILDDVAGAVVSKSTEPRQNGGSKKSSRGAKAMPGGVNAVAELVQSAVNVILTFDTVVVLLPRQGACAHSASWHAHRELMAPEHTPLRAVSPWTCPVARSYEQRASLRGLALTILKPFPREVHEKFRVHRWASSRGGRVGTGAGKAVARRPREVEAAGGSDSKEKCQLSWAI